MGIMQTKLYNPLIFCGMGCTGTGGEVGNCRLRTILQNDEGREIFVEITDSPICGGVATSVFYFDSDWDRNREQSNEFIPLYHKSFEYTNEGILNFINDNLKCSFSGIELTNKRPDKVLCASGFSKNKYKDDMININVLNGIKPLASHKHLRKYTISYETVLLFMSNYIEKQDEYRKIKFPNYKYFTIFRFDEDGTITGMDINSNNDFCCMSFGLDDTKKMIEMLIK